MHLRRATADDALTLARLYDLVWSRETGTLGEKLAAERRADELTVGKWLERDTYFIVEVEGCIRAAIGCEAKHGTLHLVHLVTHPQHRRRGFARALMEKAELYAKKIGVNKLWFDTAPGLDAAQNLYQSLGYTRCGRLRRHYWGTDVVLYEKLL